MNINLYLEVKINGSILGSFGSYKVYIGKYRHNPDKEMCRAAMKLYQRVLSETRYQKDTVIHKVIVNDQEDITGKVIAYQEEQNEGWLPF